MSERVVSVATIDASTGEEVPAGELAFAPFDIMAVAGNPSTGLPQWKSLPLPTDEPLEVFVSFQEGSAFVSIQVRSGSANVAALMCDSPAFLKFLSPLGQEIVLTFRSRT